MKKIIGNGKPKIVLKSYTRTEVTGNNDDLSLSGILANHGL